MSLDTNINSSYSDKIYNFLFHPLSKDCSRKRNVAAVITNIAMTIFSLGFWQVISFAVRSNERNLKFQLQLKATVKSRKQKNKLHNSNINSNINGSGSRNNVNISIHKHKPENNVEVLSNSTNPNKNDNVYGSGENKIVDSTHNSQVQPPAKSLVGYNQSPVYSNSSNSDPNNKNLSLDNISNQIEEGEKKVIALKSQVHENAVELINELNKDNVNIENFELSFKNLNDLKNQYNKQRKSTSDYIWDNLRKDTSLSEKRELFNNSHLEAIEPEQFNIRSNDLTNLFEKFDISHFNDYIYKQKTWDASVFFLRTAEGETIAIELKANTSGSGLKSQLKDGLKHKEFGPNDDLRLIYAGRQIGDEEIISPYLEFIHVIKARSKHENINAYLKLLYTILDEKEYSTIHEIKDIVLRSLDAKFNTVDDESNNKNYDKLLDLYKQKYNKLQELISSYDDKAKNSNIKVAEIAKYFNMTEQDLIGSAKQILVSQKDVLKNMQKKLNLLANEEGLKKLVFEEYPAMRIALSKLDPKSINDDNTITLKKAAHIYLKLQVYIDKINSDVNLNKDDAYTIVRDLQKISSHMLCSLGIVNEKLKNHKLLSTSTES